MTGALALVAALTISSQLQTHPTGLPSIGPSRANSLRTAPIMDKLYEQAGKPALDFNFARFKDLHDDASGKTSLITFARSAAQSPGTYVGSDGLIHDAAVNLALYSEQFDNAAWIRSGTVAEANQIAAPDGKQTADKLRENSATSTHLAYQSISISAGQTGTFSIYAKAAERTILGVAFSIPSDSGVYVDLSDGSLASFLGTQPDSYFVESVGDGWYRISITDGTNKGSPFVILSDGSPTTSRDSYAGDDSSGLYIWGAQLEETDPATMAPTAYIHTTSQALAAPRFDHVPTTGNLTTNLITYSEMFNVGRFYTRLNAPAENVTAAPDGTTTADYIEQQSGQTNPGYIYTIPGLPSDTYTLSIYAKASEKSGLRMQLTTGVEGRFDLSSGAVVSSSGSVTASIENAGNGWWRCTISATTATGAVLYHIYDDASFSGSSIDSGGLFLWGEQLETGPTPGPYVRTLSETRSISDANAESLGLLVEEARANLLTNSEAFASWSAAYAIVTDDAATAPDGTQTADKITFTSIGYGSRYQTITTTTSATYSVSAFAKADTHDQFSIEFRGSGSTPDAVFDLSSGTVASGSGTIEDYGNGWFRCTVTKAAVDTSELVILGRGTTGSVNDSIFLWGAQLEAGSFPTSYIPTVTSQYRYADVAAVQDADFSTTNLLAYSESFDVGWTMTGFDPVTVNATISPDGQMTADLLTPDSGVSNKRIYFSLATPNDNVFSFYAKSNGWQYIGSNPTNTNGGPVFDIINGTVAKQGTSDRAASIESVGNGWYRCIINYLANPYNSYNIVFLDSNAAFYQGTSATGNGIDGAYIWGASLTATEYPVEYVTTRNLLTDSQDFERSGWVKTNATIANDVAQAPDGTLTADRIIETGSGGHYVRNNISIAVYGDVTASVYVKKDRWDYAVMQAIGMSPNTCWFELADGGQVTSGCNASVSGVGNGWFRFQMTTPAFTVTSFQIGAADSMGSNVYAGDGTSGIYLWGAQLEPGTTATDYVRTVDVVGKDYQWYEPTEGTVFAEADVNGIGANVATIAYVSNYPTNSPDNRLEIRYGTPSQSRIYSNAPASSFDMFFARPAIGSTFSAATAYRKDDFAGIFSGQSIQTDNSGDAAYPMTAIHIGQNSAGTTTLNGHIKRLTYWPRRQADSTLQVITQ